jgi:hydrogenase maturation protease
MNRSDILIIGYGNEIRGDDGAGLRVAEALEALRLPGLRVIACHQLTPDLAEPLADARAAFFADARPADEGAPIEVFPVLPEAKGGFSLHSGSPAGLLALAQALYGRCPPAWCVAIPAVDFELGETLTETARHGVAAAVAAIQERVAELHRAG